MSGIPAGAGQLLGKRLGKFEILALLALGGTAEIYLARIGGAAGFEKYVVVKCLHDHLADDAEFVKMFLDEARLAAHLDHSNIVQTMELGQHEGRYYMVMEFLAGLSLAMIVRRAAERLPNTRIPVALVLNILAQSCAGLHYAHEKAMNGRALNIVHRDISPQNLVISFEGVVKVVDFGIAKAEMRETRTRSGTIKGKFAYMSPEQCVANNVDRRTDVFALGVIGHELLTGRRLFKRPSPYETYQSVIECNVTPPSMLDAALDPALDPVIMRAVTKDKADRYPTAEAFGDALLGYLHHRGIGSGPGDVSRFFDAYFGQELDEHSGRMRELISGRDVSMETGVSWGDDDVEDDLRREAAEAARRSGTADGSLVRESGDIEQLHRPSTGSRSSMIDDLGGGSRVEDDDEMPAERTRIESNPLERVNELERLSRVPAAGGARLPPSGAVPLPAPPPGSGGRAPMPGMPVSGRFPDLANLPTMIAEGDRGLVVPAAVDGFGNAPTRLAPTAVPAATDGFANAPTSLAPTAVPAAAPAFGNPPSRLARPSSPDQAKTQLAPIPSGPPGPSGYPAGAGNGVPPPGGQARSPAPANPPATSPPPVTPFGPQPIPQGYPVMNAQLSAQIATGATVFPSNQPGSPGAAPPGAHPGPRSPDPIAPPSGYPPIPPPPPDGGSGMMRPGEGTLVDPQRAATMMSPVGPYYAEHVDWGAAAGARARAVPPWLLAVLFVGAIGVALTLTIVIARLVT